MAFKFHRSSSSSVEDSTYAPTVRKLPKWQWYLLAAVILSPIIYFLVKIIISLFFVTASGYITSDMVNIRAPHDAYVENINVHLADNVKPEDILLTLKSPSLNAQIAALNANVALLKMNRDTYSNQATLAELREVEAVAKKHVQETKAYYEQIQLNYQKGLTTVMNVSTAENRYHAALHSLNQAQAQIALSEQTFSITSQQNYDQLLAPAEQELASLEAIKKGLVIKSARTGVVTNLMTQNDEFVSLGMPLMTLSTNQNWHVTAFFEGKDVTQIYPGRSVKIVLPDFTVLSGHIMNQPSTTQSENQMFVVLQNPAQRLVTYITLDKPLPQNYQVNGMQVTGILF